MSKEMEIKQECCNIWNNLKDKTKMIDYLIESKQQIFDLEAKLAAKERDFALLMLSKNEEINEWIAVRDDKNKVINRQTEKINQLKQQLAEKEKENNELIFIIEEIEQFAWEQLNNENFDKYKAYDEMLTKIKQLTKNSPYENHQQDKISFCIEKLQEAKRLLEEKYTYDVGESDFAVIYEDAIDEIIDNQIKQLKEMK